MQAGSVALVHGLMCPAFLPLGALHRYRSLTVNAAVSKTQEILGNVSINGEVGGAGGAYSYEALKRLDRIRLSICSPKPDTNETIELVKRFPSTCRHSQSENEIQEIFDVLVCGGTLGIFLATALRTKGLRVGIIEKNVIKGRAQEWNISMNELLELVEAGILERDDIEQISVIKFNPNRCGFEGKGDIWVEDILNLGVLPAKLVEIMRRRFLSLGGVIFEGQSVANICIYDDVAVLEIDKEKKLYSRLIIDAMGNFSPIVKQIRSKRKPDGMCLVVGTCSRGFKENVTSDVIFSNLPVKTIEDSRVQYFWEAFPSGSGPTDRTTYLFTYVDDLRGCPSLEQLLDDYWDLMPAYQGVQLDDLEILRVIFGMFPAYRDSGIQSPVSFGGFCSMTRHLKRLATGIYEAVRGDYVDSYSLSKINPYMPNLSASWLFLRSMSASRNPDVSPDFINELLHINFQCMQKLGDPVLRPFLQQDIIQFTPLAKTLGLISITRPEILPSIFKQVGIPAVLEWSVHFFMLGYYTFLSSFLDPLMRPWIDVLPDKQKYEWRRNFDAWKYGSGLDYK
ncbi:hypothetical protein AMTRI_Chr10g3570 [Amborella trichopoda]